MKFRTVALAFGVAAVGIATTAQSATILLTEGSGWNYGESHAANSAKMYNYDGAGGLFTLKAVVTGNDDLSFVDGFVPGDVYAVSINAIAGKTQFLGPTSFDPIPNLFGGPFGTTFGPAWLNAAYGHFQASLTPGTYTITVKDLCGVKGNTACPGFPAGWGIRLDAVVPEAPTWAIMLFGLAGIGGALRTRRGAIAA